jgi:hypothetical protein
MGRQNNVKIVDFLQEFKVSKIHGSIGGELFKELILRGGWAMYEKEEAFYLANKPELLAKYHGKHIVIVGEEVIGVYDDAGTACHGAIKTYPLGSFMLKDVPEDIEDEIPYIFPFVDFAPAFFGAGSFMPSIAPPAMAQR